MRITNPMMASKMMLNINRNTARVDNLYTQWASTKKIQFPSENPILASRALKFRTTLAENSQYQKNVSQGLSWMEVTENSFKEVTNVFAQIRSLAVQGDGAESFEDKQAMATQIKSLLSQLGLAMNASYTGRYIFSGYRTDEPGLFLEDFPNLQYTDITQSFTGKDIEKIKAYQKFGAGEEPVITDASILKLPYKFCETDSVRVTVAGIDKDSDGNDDVITAKSVSVNDVNAYKPGASDIYYVEETGELVLGSDYTSASKFDVKYDKTGFTQGELNPKVYFTCTDSLGDTYTMNNQDIEYEFGIGTRFAVNSLAKDVFTPQMYADIMSFCDSVLNVDVSEKSDVLARLKADPANAKKTQAELELMAEEQITREKEKIETTLQQKFSNMIALVDKHSSTVSKEQTDLGARMTRLDLVQKRLEEEETSYTKLLSENEDADLLELAMLLKNAESVYEASLQVGMNMIQISLVNYL